MCGLPVTEQFASVSKSANLPPRTSRPTETRETSSWPHETFWRTGPMTTADISPTRPLDAKPDRTNAERQRRYRKRRRANPHVTARPAPVTVTVPATAGIDLAAYVAALALAGVAAFFSISGMVVLFPGAPLAVVAMAVAMEGAKLVTAGWLASRWRVTAWVWRLTLVALVAGLAVINATGVYAQLVAAHVGEGGVAMSMIETQNAALAARIEVQAHTVADLDRRLGQIDIAIEEAAKRGRTVTALTAIEAQHKSREALAGQRQREASTLADLKAERAALGAKGQQIETEAAPIRYVAEFIWADADSEWAIRWLIALMVLCCDPLG
jgi:hypothetical protein